MGDRATGLAPHHTHASMWVPSSRAAVCLPMPLPPPHTHTTKTRSLMGSPPTSPSGVALVSVHGSSPSTVIAKRSVLASQSLLVTSASTTSTAVRGNASMTAAEVCPAFSYVSLAWCLSLPTFCLRAALLPTASPRTVSFPPTHPPHPHSFHTRGLWPTIRIPTTQHDLDFNLCHDLGYLFIRGCAVYGLQFESQQ